MNDPKINSLYEDAVKLLQQLISIPSLSREEDKTALAIENFLHQKNIVADRAMNNVWATNRFFDASRPSILLNSHHDTVPANSKYSNDPFDPKIEEGKLFGLGSTDAGASLVSLLACFIYFYEKKDLPFNIVFAASAEEEISGANGIEKLFSEKSFNDLFKNENSFAIVGEPTQLELAVAEKGLLVLDCTANGKAGHAAREEGDNAIYKAIAAIEWFKAYRFDKVSPLLGEVKMTVTSIHTENKAHNVVPATCSFVVDVRVTEMYTHQEIIQTINQYVEVDVKARSTRLRSSYITEDHPVIRAGKKLGKKIYGSPTLSDKALIPLPALKCGPGFSAQSHSADEFVLLNDIKQGVGFYIELLEELIINN
ncbi:M20/M25/M40 family metallo-hydrolase [Ferruginibacter sp. HRS2-29]|nr:M20/M25/M40 family metallo-hydrolase [Ferruginibacter sp. HRS2-29]